MVLKVLGQKEEPSVKWLQSEGPTLQPSTLDELQALEKPEEPPELGHCPFPDGKSFVTALSLHGALGVLTRALSSTWY